MFPRFRYRFLLSLLFALVLQQLPVHGQQGYQFSNYTTGNGLSDNRVTCFYKDKTGFMWIGTENGLNRFDGHRFFTYFPGRQTRRISHSHINDIAGDSRNRLWVATNNGLNIIDTRRDTTLVLLPDDNRKGIPSNLVWDTYIDNRDRVWMAADLRDLCYYDISKDEFVFFPWRDYVRKHFPQRQNKYNSIRKIYPKSAGELWLGTTLGLFSFTISTGTFHYWPSLQVDHFIQLQAAPGDSMIYFVQNPGEVLQVLSVIRQHTKEVPWAAIPLWNSFPGSGPDKLCWLPAGRDLLEINKLTGTCRKIQHITDDPYSLPAGVVRTVYPEPDGLVWVATDQGFSLFNAAASFFRFHPVWADQPKTPVPENDLFRTDHQVYAVFHSRTDHKYYVSSPARDCLVIMDAVSGERKVIRTIAGIPLKNCATLFEDKKGMLWILANRHAFRYDRAQNKFSVSAFRCSTGNTLLTDMVEDKDGNLWIASFNDGVYRYDPDKGITTRLPDGRSRGLRFPSSLYYDHTYNRLWIGTFSIGLICYELDTDTLRHFNQESKSGHMQTSLITDVRGDSDGYLWVASYAGGLSKYPLNAISNQFVPVTAPGGLPGNNLFSLVSDRQGQIWGTNGLGLFSVRTSDGLLQQYDRSFGLGSADFHSPLSISWQGELFTGIENGFIGFQPEHLALSSSPFPVVITGFRTKMRHELNVSRLQSPWRLSYDDNEVTFAFAGLSYASPKKTVYFYKLEGLDDNWTSNGNNSSVRYNNLAPGVYRFRVRAIDFAGRTSANEAMLSFEIAAPWWGTWWFRIPACILLVGLSIFLYRKQVRSIKDKASVRLQMAGLKEQALRSRMNPHFIFNSLNSIQELIVTENHVASHHYLSKFSKLMRLVLHFSEKDLIPLSNELEVCQLYLELESLRFKNELQYQVTIDPDIDAESTLFPSLLLQPFVENAIWHGLIPKPGEKKLDIRLEEHGDDLICTIRDNGIGREKAAAIKAGKLGALLDESKGIAMARQRIETMKIAGISRSSIIITDDKDAEGHISGTLVTLIISSIQEQL